LQADVRRKIRIARARLAAVELFEAARAVLLLAGVLAVLAVLTQKLLAIQLLNSYFVWGFSAACAAATLGWWFFRIPSRQKACLIIDKRLALRERTSTLIALEKSADVFAQAACSEAQERIRNTNLRGHFPVLVSKNWFYSVGLWCAAVLLVMLLPQYDLLGYLRRENEQVKLAQDVKLAEKMVEQTTGSVKLAVKQLGDEQLAKELEDLAAARPDQSPEEVKRQAIQKLGDLSDKLKQLEAGMNKEALELSKQMLKNLKPSAEPLSQKLQQAIAKGDFGLAKDMLEQFRDQLQQGDLSEEQKRQLAEQLQNLGKQLEKIAAENKMLEEALEKFGLDKKLANLSPEEFQKMLQKQSLSPEQMQQLMQKFQGCKSACSSCAGLGRAMAACGLGSAGLTGGELGELAAQLSELESFEEQMKLIAAGLSEIEGAVACLGKGMCQGSQCGRYGGEGWSDSDQPSSTAGLGGGTKHMGDPVEADPKATKVEGKLGEGQAVASWYFKGEQIKGQSSKELDQRIKAAKDNAAQAISEQQIPRRYEESVKKYFGGLEAQVQE